MAWSGLVGSIGDLVVKFVTDHCFFVHPLFGASEKAPKRSRQDFALHEIVAVLWEGLRVEVDRAILRLIGRTMDADPRVYKKFHAPVNTLTGEQWNQAAAIIAHALPDGQDDLQNLSSTAECAELVTEYCACAFGVALDAKLVEELIGPLCIQGIAEPSAFLAKTLARCDVMEEVLGKRLCVHLRQFMHESAWGLECVREPVQATDVLLQELVETKRELAHAKIALRDKPRDETFCIVGESLIVGAAAQTCQAKTRRSAPVHVCANEELKQRMLEFALKRNVAFTHAPSALYDASSVVTFAHDRSEFGRACIELVTDKTMCAYALELDSALDAYAGDQIREHRDAGKYFSCSFTSDEAAPNNRSLVGLRFQVTHLYYLLWEPRERWHAKVIGMPFRRFRVMTDMMHAPHKTGDETLKIVARQVERKGVLMSDICAGAGDGGGENEGISGVHTLMTAYNGSYVRRRCFGHLAWTVARAGLGMMESRKAVDALETYLADGVTWTRLSAIATSTVHQGGIALMRYQSTLYKFVFGKSPPHIIDDRPETNVAFLEWLIPRERHILPCVEKDLEQRDWQQSNIPARSIHIEGSISRFATHD